jgi:hypothetical protein
LSLDQQAVVESNNAFALRNSTRLGENGVDKGPTEKGRLAGTGTKAMAFRHPQPATEQAFEEFCLKFLQAHWNYPGLSLFGERGERQYGIDIFDERGQSPHRAAQCKLRKDGKALQPSEIEGEVEKALQFPDGLANYTILTTARVSTAAQRKVSALNREHLKKGLFSIDLMTWDKIERLIDDEYPRLRDELHPAGNSHLRSIDRKLRAIAAMSFAVFGLCTWLVFLGASRQQHGFDADVDSALTDGCITLEDLAFDRIPTRVPKARIIVPANWNASLGAAFGTGYGSGVNPFNPGFGSWNY